MIRKFIAAVALAAISVIAIGCDDTGAQSTSRQNAVKVEANQQRLQTVLPAPVLQTSLERKNLIERLERINKQNMSGYIYLISQGRVVSFYPVRGKVTSLNAYLMAGEAMQPDPYTSMDGRQSLMVEQPDYDGAYGENAKGVFFFTADTNAYVEWAGEYIFSDQPLKLSQEPLMVREIK